MGGSQSSPVGRFLSPQSFEGAGRVRIDRGHGRRSVQKMHPRPPLVVVNAIGWDEWAMVFW